MKKDNYLKVFQHDLKEFIQEQFRELIELSGLKPTKQSNKFLDSAEYMNLLRVYI